MILDSLWCSFRLRISLVDIDVNFIMKMESLDCESCSRSYGTFFTECRNWNLCVMAELMSFVFRIGF